MVAGRRIPVLFGMAFGHAVSVEKSNIYFDSGGRAGCFGLPVPMPNLGCARNCHVGTPPIFIGCAPAGSPSGSFVASWKNIQQRLVVQNLRMVRSNDCGIWWAHFRIIRNPDAYRANVTRNFLFLGCPPCSWRSRGCPLENSPKQNLGKYWKNQLWNLCLPFGSSIFTWTKIEDLVFHDQCMDGYRHCNDDDIDIDSTCSNVLALFWGTDQSIPAAFLEWRSSTDENHRSAASGIFCFFTPVLALPPLQIAPFLAWAEYPANALLFRWDKWILVFF